MARFRPCLGREACVYGDDGCRTCGRSFEEILRTKQLVEDLTMLVLEVDYEDLDELITYLGDKLRNKVRARRNGQVNGH